MLDELMGAGFFEESDPNAGRPEPDEEVPSHLTLEVDEDGNPALVRFTYVDEDTCIGCRNCALVARSTFFMEDSLAGKARVFNQGGDSDDLIDEAIDSCPVNCIHYVSHEDLVTLERERLGREDSLDFNNYASFKRSWTGQDNAVPETNAQYYGSLASGTRCNNCPSRGCQKCPMFGVGMNPVYLQRLQAREEKKRLSGAAAREAADREAAEAIDTIYADDAFAGASGAAAGAEDGGAMDAIFGQGYSFDSLDEDGEVDAAAPPGMVPSEAAREAAEALRAAIDDDEGEAANLDPYAVLGVKRDASLPEIKRAFRRMALRWHPDRCADLPEVERLQAELIFKQVNLANEVLSNAAKRREYDDGARNFADLVSGFWQSLSRRMRSRSQKGVVVATGSGLSLRELAEEEEADSGIEAASFMLGAAAAADEEDAP